VVYNSILVYEGIVDLQCLVFHPWTAARPLLNADRQLTASMSWVFFSSMQAPIPLVVFEMPVGHHRGTPGGAIMIFDWRIGGLLSGFDGHKVNVD
jgi:hypothetical protein